jgi:transcriptional regulator with XRE-family HTH domain
VAQIKTDRITATLRRRLFKAPSVEAFVKENSDLFVSTQLHEYLRELRRASGLSPAEIVKHCNIDRTYLHQLFNGTRKPSRDKLLQLSFGFGLDDEQTQALLKVARMSSLYPRIVRDAAILRCLHDRKRFDETEELLRRMGLTPLDGEDA